MNYAKIYNSIVSKRKNNVTPGYTEEHHIIPRCLGGTDDKDNLVELTAKEHFICHLLLTKMYTKGSNEYYKMCHAFMMMLVRSKNQNRYITSKKYELLKTDFSKRMSIINSGKNNKQYDTIWIFNAILQENKKIPKNDIIETGWSKGRIINWNLYNINQAKIKERQNKRKQKILDKQNKTNKHKIHQDNLNAIDWDFMYELYQMYGFDITKELTGYNKTREAMLMQFKKRVTNYRPSQKTKRISEDRCILP